MNVKLIQVTQNPIDVMWTAARTCYSEKSPIEIWEDKYGKVSDGCDHSCEYVEECTEKHWNLVKTVLESGHESIAEGVSFTFAIEGVSRSLMAQLTRHRAGVVFAIQSQRYVNFQGKAFNYVTPPTIDKKEEAQALYHDFMKLCKEKYDELVSMGIPPEDARYVLPNASCTNITMTINLRELRHVCALRLCSRAQLEIRQLFQAIKKEVQKVDERLASLLVPTCEVLSYCPEHKGCGRKPSKNEIFKS